MHGHWIFVLSQLTLKAPSKFAEDGMIYLLEKCLAEDSHERSCLISFEKQRKLFKNPSTLKDITSQTDLYLVSLS